MLRAGRLLVANPLLPDPNFDRTVVLLLAHNEDGALGLVLNRPSRMEVGDPLPEWKHLAAEPGVLFLGGPVQHQAVICLGRELTGAADEDGWKEVSPGVGTIDLERDPNDVPVGVREVRMFAGYAGWSAGQLEGELDAGAWWVVEPEPDDAFTTQPDQLWKQVLRRQPFPLAFSSWYPEDPAYQ
ncbi:MAG TPA: YqgE/AlgH family protein [Acidimicrobiales bacterium]|nr:YqgE/AlgH family protein [Acidimicrobiales bacterium]